MSNYHIAIDRDGNYDLAHYGVPGMKWKDHIYSHDESEQLDGKGRFRGKKSLNAYGKMMTRQTQMRTNVSQASSQISGSQYGGGNYSSAKETAEKEKETKSSKSPRAVSRGVAIKEVSAARQRGRDLVVKLIGAAPSAASAAAKKGQELLDRLFGRKR